MDRPDPDAWDPARFVAEPPAVRPNRDALGQSLRAACALMVVTLVALAVGLLKIDRAVRVAVEFAVLPLILAAFFVALVAWSSPKPWRARTYLIGVGAFAAVVTTAVVIATRSA